MKQTKGFVYGILSSATFGLIPLFALPALKAGMDLESVVVYRFGLSTLFLGMYLLLTKHPMKISSKELVTLVGLGLLYGITSLFLTTSYLYIPSGMATTIHFLYPVVVTSIMIFVFKERLSPSILMAFILALVGIFILTSGEGNGTISSYLISCYYRDRC